MPSRVYLALALVLAFLLSWAAVWYRVGHRVTAEDDYFLRPEQLCITPVPGWIRSDVKAEVLRDASLDRPLSILDTDLAERIFRAFPIHPWVAKVRQVRKFYPARVEVELEYRRPVCMVEVPGGVFAVDSQGVLLPSGDFSPTDASRYPLLTGVKTIPGQVGAAWPDDHVLGGCRLAAAIADAWLELRLGRIVVVEQPADSPGTLYRYELLARGGARILWGQPPDGSPAGLDTAKAKITRLKKHLAKHGTLETPGEAIDLRPVESP